MRATAGERVFRVFNGMLCIFFSITILYPVWEKVVNSFSTETEIIGRWAFRLFPREAYLGHWELILRSPLIWQTFINSVIVTGCASFYSLLLSAMYAYPLSRKDLPGRNLWTFIPVFTMFFSGGLIPYYLLMRSLGLINDRLVLILGTVNAWNTLIVRNYFMTIPNELQDSAKVDGAREVGILFRTMIPLAMPVMATVLLWNLVGNWNAWVSSMIFISDPLKQVVQIPLRLLLTQPNYTVLTQGQTIYEEMAMMKRMQMEKEGLKSAMLVFTILPILLSYPFLQKYFVRGILIGSLKG